ncbi:peptidoglycan DD-metalloendopeptidase family protein [Aneurinibacillus aneurinilyticus]|uniref:peptidoglycan DD-metalloendopeptidase family protein n=1 Tax=Aneurinibacillus aneurinilyticus TaxID=1391 RepID=UPI002E1E2C1E|nr:peptidoglycan DD-metalloendopeptidase family protein [Aneurinibacillus aneurinilyticus]MED0722205.1 peptidoglycan DD-metalloendopeptidase family protein [Aneurinibacillus aneurinilyticus]
MLVKFGKKKGNRGRGSPAKWILLVCVMLLLVPMGILLAVQVMLTQMASSVWIEKTAHERYKENPEKVYIPPDLITDWYIPASQVFDVPWSVFAGIHMVQTRFAREPGFFWFVERRDAFDLPDSFWEAHKYSKREWEWWQEEHTEEEIKEHVPIPPERDRFEDIIWTVGHYLSSVSDWKSRRAAFPAINKITESNADTDQALLFAWLFNSQYALTGTIISPDPSQLASSMIPPEYMEIYKEVEAEFGIPWNYLAAFHFIETRFGTYVNPKTGKLMVSEAGAIGHFQFMPGTWREFGMGGDPFNPRDSARAAANYLKASGFFEDMDKAIYAYNHSWTYVNNIKTQAALFAEIPATGEAGGSPVATVPGAKVIPLKNFRVASKFGYRIHPILKTKKLHAGIDLAAPMMTPVYAFMAGKVVYSGSAGGYGTLIKIDHGNGIQTWYGHCKRLYVSAGMTVPAGYTISAVGSEGQSTGPHLHFEVRINGKAVDPAPYLGL